MVVLALYTFAFRPRPALQGVSSVATAATGAKARAKAAQSAAAAKVAKPAPAAKDASAKPAEATGALTPKVLRPETWVSDPFVRDWVMVNELANLKLKAITLGGDHPYALINDQILQIGDEISGKKVVNIESDNVTLEQGGRTFTLLLGE